MLGLCPAGLADGVGCWRWPPTSLSTPPLPTSLWPQGGGNCGNALTAAARLGLAPTIVSKIGGDGVGDGILAEFRRDGVDTAHMLRAPGAPSPFTYIIVDRQGAPAPAPQRPAPTTGSRATHAVLPPRLAGLPGCQLTPCAAAGPCSL